MAVTIERRTHQVFNTVLSWTFSETDAQPVYVEHIRRRAILFRVKTAGDVVAMDHGCAPPHKWVKEKAPRIGTLGYLFTRYRFS